MAKKNLLFQVDAFTDQIFSGNPAGVCLLDNEADPEWMQKVASEMNLSETAFIYKKENYFKIRYFTPTVEVPLCGHATLSCSHVLFEENLVSEIDAIHFKANDDELYVSKDGNWIVMDFPKDSIEDVEVDVNLFLDELQIEKDDILEIKQSSMGWFLLRLGSDEVVRDLIPNFDKMQRNEHEIVITSETSSEEYDFVSRFFAPTFGINEDPVTGIAHLTLGQYWSTILGKNQLLGRQISRRGGTVKIAVDEKRISIMGKAITVFKTSI